MATHVAAQAATEATRAGVEVRVAAGPAVVHGDPVLLERLVQNLVENGLRHNVADGGRVQVTTGAEGTDRVSVVVDNTGPVVPAYDIPAIFEPFLRLRRTMETMGTIRRRVPASGFRSYARSRALMAVSLPRPPATAAA